MFLEVVQQVFFGVQAVVDHPRFQEGHIECVPFSCEGVPVELLALAVFVQRGSPGFFEGEAESYSAEDVGREGCPSFEDAEPLGGFLADAYSVEANRGSPLGVSRNILHLRSRMRSGRRTGDDRLG